MPEKNKNEQSDFMIEKIKERPVNRKKLLKRTVITVALAIVFGLVACFTFLVIEPIISNWLYPEEEPQIVLFPEDQEEMSPEEMLSDTMQSMQNIQNAQNADKAEEQEPTSVTLEKEQVDEILDSVELDLDNYKEIYSALQSYVKELEASMVTITGTSSDVDWLNNVTESSNQSSGVIIANNGKELLILADYGPVEKAQKLVVNFYNAIQADAHVKQLDENTDLAIIAVERSGFTKDFLNKIKIVSLGSSNSKSTVGMPVVALGNPMGSSGSMAYGIIAGESSQTMVDSRYKILQTDIYGSQKAGGVLFDLKGQLIGVITEASSDIKNLIVAYGISDLRKLIEKMSNGVPVPYLGIKGMDVSEEANAELQVPFGAYVKEVAKNSPAMLGGIQQGDVIVSIDGASVESFSDYITMLMGKQAGSEIDLVLMRQSQEEYKEMTLEITLGESGKEE